MEELLSPKSAIEARQIANSTLDKTEAAFMSFVASAYDAGFLYIDYLGCFHEAVDDCATSGLFGVDKVLCWMEFITPCIVRKMTAQFNTRLVNIETGISTDIDAATLEITSLVGSEGVAIRANIAESTQTLTTLVTEFESEIASTLGPPIQTIADFLDNLDTQIAEIIGAATVPLVAFLDEVTDDFSDTVTQFLQTNEAFFLEISDSVTGSIDSLVTSIETGIDILAADPEAFRLIITDFLDGLPALITKEIGIPLSDKIGVPQGESFIDWLFSFLSDKAEETTASALSFVDNLPIEEAQKEGIRKTMQGIGTSSLVKVFYTIATSFWLGIAEFQRGKIAAAANSQMLERKELKYERASPDEIIAAFHRGFLPESIYNDSIDETGLPFAHIVLKRELLRTRLNMPELWSVHRRGITDKDLHNRLLAEIGIEGVTASLSEQATEFIPSPQDLIRFMVREVFAADIISLFGLDKEFPSEAISEGQKLGVPEETMRQFWAAHWELPGVQMGFDMWHRGIITETDLAALLKTKDIMPFWRDKLMGLSNRLITRVDIRRIHSLGLKDLTWVNDQFRKRGYSENDASDLTRFTEEINKPDDPADSEDFTALTRALIIKLFKEDVLSENTTTGLLETLGYGPNNADFIVVLAKIEMDSATRRESLSIIKEQFRAGSLDFDEVQVDLAAIGATVPERDKMIAQLENIRKGRLTLPTIAQLTGLFNDGIIDRGRVISALEGRGYSDFWVDALAQQITSGG